MKGKVCTTTTTTGTNVNTTMGVKYYTSVERGVGVHLKPSPWATSAARGGATDMPTKPLFQPFHAWKGGVH